MMLEVGFSHLYKLSETLILGLLVLFCYGHQDDTRHAFKFILTSEAGKVSSYSTKLCMCIAEMMLP